MLVVMLMLMLVMLMFAMFCHFNSVMSFCFNKNISEKRNIALIPDSFKLNEINIIVEAPELSFKAQ